MSNGSRLPITSLDAALDDLLAVNPVFLSAVERQAALRNLSRVVARAEAARLRVLAVADDVALEAGARSAGRPVSTLARRAPWNASPWRSTTDGTGWPTRWPPGR